MRTSLALKRAGGNSCRRTADAFLFCGRLGLGPAARYNVDSTFPILQRNAVHGYHVRCSVCAAQLLVEPRDLQCRARLLAPMRHSTPSALKAACQNQNLRQTVAVLVEYEMWD